MSEIYFMLLKNNFNKYKLYYFRKYLSTWVSIEYNNIIWKCLKIERDLIQWRIILIFRLLQRKIRHFENKKKYI